MKNLLPDPCPIYWDKLNDIDKASYILLRQTLSSPVCKNRRNRSAETFQEIIEAIKSFVVRNKEDDINRGLVCGLVWIGNDIAINIRQLRLLLSKCKSSINGSFQMIGYSTIPQNAESTTLLLNTFPFLKNNFGEMRQWTIRHFIDKNNNIENINLDSGSCQYITPPPDLIQNELNGTEISIDDSIDNYLTFNNDLDKLNEINDSLGFWDTLSMKYSQNNENNFEKDFEPFLSLE